mmetsp:Transcript_17982/g.59041  ORF Transcript_17982/g.59041 Transcript_17982/m.59041 type:complete len:234 (+) Transcript_17982:2280-2981(+)
MAAEDVVEVLDVQVVDALRQPLHHFVVHVFGRPQLKLGHGSQDAADLVCLHALGDVPHLRHDQHDVLLVDLELQLEVGKEVGADLPPVKPRYHDGRELRQSSLEDGGRMNVEVRKRSEQTDEVCITPGRAPQRFSCQFQRDHLNKLVVRLHLPLAKVPQDVHKAVHVDHRLVLVHVLAQYRWQLLAPTLFAPDQVVKDGHEGALVHGGEEQLDMLCDGSLHLSAEGIPELLQG